MGEWWRSSNGPRHTISDGLRWGVGFSIGNLVVRVVLEGLNMGFRKSKKTTISSQESPAPPSVSPAKSVCVGPAKAFEQCLNTNGSNISQCQIFMEKISECLKNSIPPPQIKVSGDCVAKEAGESRVWVKFKSDKSDNA